MVFAFRTVINVPLWYYHQPANASEATSAVGIGQARSGDGSGDGAGCSVFVASIFTFVGLLPDQHSDDGDGDSGEERDPDADSDPERPGLVRRPPHPCRSVPGRQAGFGLVAFF